MESSGVVGVVLAFAGGGAVGALVATLVVRSVVSRLTAEKLSLERECRASAEALVEARRTIDGLREDLTSARVAQERASASLETERQGFGEKLALLEQTEQKMREAFAEISRASLQANSQTFFELASTRLAEAQAAAKGDLDERRKAVEGLVRPIQDGLERIEGVVKHVDEERIKAGAALDQQMRQLAEGQRSLTGETQQLVKALRTPHVRGQWGEMQLRRVVELAGMMSHADFMEQVTVDGDDGKLRPDLVVSLPGEKVIVVDAKAPLSAYLDALEEPDPEQQAKHLDRHAKQVRAHVAELAARNYANQLAASPDFSVMFLPGEAFFSAACQRDPTLIDFAIGQNVIPASPTTLITLLKAVAYGWQQERIAEGAEEIRDLGVTLYERVAIVAEHLAKIRKGLDGAVAAYNSAVSSLEGRFLPTARKLGAKSGASAEALEVLEEVEHRPRLPSTPELTHTEVVTPEGKPLP